MPSFKLLACLILFTSLAACSFKTQREEGFPVGKGEVSQVRPPASTTSAVLSLLGKARQAALEGELVKAESQLERALRIEPRNAAVWHYMAKLRLNQGKLEQAAGLAAKSNSLEKRDKQLQADNWRIIAHARHQKGDLQGARQAQEKARQLLD
ncbi:MAG: tetratricopeptide repeat protein [Gammaproteobacteria bacterium]|nr:tetratricopeptide repeat protein [Gammaproteobacteria bacterium]